MLISPKVGEKWYSVTRLDAKKSPHLCELFILQVNDEYITARSVDPRGIDAVEHLIFPDGTFDKVVGQTPEIAWNKALENIVEKTKRLHFAYAEWCYREMQTPNLKASI